MYLKLLILIIIQFFFTFVHCFKDSSYLKQRLSEIQENAQTIHNLNADMCRHMDVYFTQKLQVCQRVFKLLRDDASVKNPYRNSIYMNYEAFSLSLINPEYPVCQEKFASINRKLVGTYMSLNCYGQPSIPSGQNNQHLKEISIFKGMNETLMVLRCLVSNVDCVFLESYNYNEWHQYSHIPPEIVNVPIPRIAGIDKLTSAFYENIKKVWKMCNTKWSLIITRYMTADEFQKLCHLLLGRPQYINKWRPTVFQNRTQGKPSITEAYLTIFEPFVTIEQLHASEVKKIELIPTLTCTKYKRKGSTSKKFKITCGPDERSVILIEPVIYKSIIHMIPVELIENLYWDYVLHIEDWF